MASTAILKVDIIANAAKAITALKGVGDTAKKQKSPLAGFAGTLAGAFSVGAVVTFGKNAVGAAEDSAKATAGLDQVFKSMGDTTGTASKDAQAYATELSKLTGISDESIIAAQTQLATFGNVSDETARAAGVFDRTTAAAADLAAAGFGTLDSNSVQLGKALQDPVKGLGSLSKAGVTFSDDQKTMIASMVEAGEVTKAQELVLAAVEEQVGGTAAATATSSEKMANAFGEVQESLGKALLPSFEKLVGFIQENLTWMVPLGLAIAGVAAAIWLWHAATVAMSVLKPIVAAVRAWTLAQGGLNLALLANPIVLIVLAVIALIAIVVLLVKNWDKVIAFLKGAWEGLKKVALAVFKAIGDFIGKVWETIKKVAMAVWNGIKAFFIGYWNVLKGIFSKPIAWLKEHIGGTFKAMGEVIRTVWNGIKSFFTTVWGNIQGIFQGAWDFFQNFLDFLGTIGDTIAETWDTVTAVISGVWSSVVDGLKSVTNWLIDKINWVIGAINSAIRVINKIPGIDIGTIPTLPRLAQGGVLTRPTLFVGGEAGREIVTPERLLRSILRSEGSGGGYTLNMNVRRADPADVAWGFRRLELLRTGR